MLFAGFIRISILTLILFSFRMVAATPVAGEDTGISSPDSGHAAEPEPYQNRWFAFPFAGYTPETSLMVGGVALRQFKPARADDETRASQILMSAIYTLNKQFLLGFYPNIILPEERWIFDGSHFYSFFPDRYWGIGPATRSAEELDVEFRVFQFEQVFLKKISADLHAGPILRWSRLSHLKLSDIDGNPVPEEQMDLEENSTLSGIGLSVRMDARNSITWPTRHHYVDISAIYYSEFLGATHPYASWKLDARAYFDLLGDGSSVLAFHLRTRLTEGQLPFQEFSMLGGQEIMRGYHEGRFRDANAMQIQAELRGRLYRRLGFAVFAASGEVWNRFEDFSLDNPKYAAGAGLRFDMNPKDTSNLRIDYGIGRHGSGLYLTIGEAF